jgi:hypothetical protein
MRKSSQLKLSVLAVLFALAFTLAPKALVAQSVVFNFLNPGNQYWTGNLASLFTVNASDVVVDDLGVFNSSATSEVSGPIQVGLYDITASTQIGPTLTFLPAVPYSQVGFAVFQPITPVTLTAGDEYEVDAVGYGLLITNPNGNSGLLPEVPRLTLDTLGGALSFNSVDPDPSVYDTSETLDFPTATNGGIPDPHSYEAATLIAAVPEGGAGIMFLLLAGGACFGAMGFRPRRRLIDLEWSLRRLPR